MIRQPPSAPTLCTDGQTRTGTDHKTLEEQNDALVVCHCCMRYGYIMIYAYFIMIFAYHVAVIQTLCVCHGAVTFPCKSDA